MINKFLETTINKLTLDQDDDIRELRKYHEFEVILNDRIRERAFVISKLKDLYEEKPA